ncbi:MAG: phage holin family protein [Patescibacteria group bacterium]
MKNILGTFLGNLAGIAAASYLVSGFVVNPRSGVIFLALVLTLLHLTVKPIVKFLTWPFIMLTLGLGLMLINAIVLAVLDFVSKNLTIKGLESLALGTLLVWGANVLIHLFMRATSEKS